MLKTGNYLFIEKDDNIVTISMTPELQDDIGTVGFVEFTEEKQLKKEDAIAHIEASKTVLEIISPVAGTILEINEAAIDNPKMLNSADTAQNWLVKLTDVSSEDFDSLADA